MARQVNVESRAFQQCFADLTIGIRYGVEQISDVAYSRALISRSVHQQVIESNQSRNKMMLLLGAIESKILVDPAGFQRFVDILKEEACYDHVVRKLELKWKELASENLVTRPGERVTGALCTLLCSWYRDNPRPPFKLHTPERKYIASNILRRLDLWYVYEDLVIHKSTHSGEEQTQNVSIEEIVQPQNGVKFIIVAGEFGFGKTAMGWELCQRWGRKVSGYEHFKAVIFCDLRSSKIQSAKTLNELLSSGAYDPSIQKAVSAEVDASDGSETLLIFDGLNMSDPNPKVQSRCLLSRCLRRQYLQGATVLITCDPSSVGHLIEMYQFQDETYQIYEVKGFSTARYESYVRTAASYCQNNIAFNNIIKFLKCNMQFRDLMKRPLNCAAITEYLLAFWNQHDCPLAHMVKMLGYLVLVWLRHYTENFLSLPHEHHIQSLFAANSQLEEFERLCCQAWECLEDENTTKPSEKDNPLCQLLPRASLDTGDLHYFTSQPVQHLLAGIHVAINLDHSEQHKLFVRSLDELSVWEKPVLDLLPHIAQLRNVQKEVPEEVTAFRALHSRCKCEISTTVSQLPMLCHHSQEATLRNSVLKISHSTSMDLESQHYSMIGELCKAGNVLELHFSDNCEEQAELHPDEIRVSMDALASTTSDCRLGYVRLLDISNRHIHNAAEIQKLGCFSGVTVMKLSNTHLNSEACRILAQTLVELHSLESLFLSRNPHIGGKGAIVQLIQSLLDKKFLQTLDLRDTGLCNSQEPDSTKDICAVAWLLMCSSTLTSLDLGSNNLDISCVKYLMHALLCNETTALKSLNISHSKFDLDTTDMLLKVMKKNRTIAELDISDCGITDMPANMPLGNSTLQKLNFIGNDLKEQTFNFVKCISSSESLQLCL